MSEAQSPTAAKPSPMGFSGFQQMISDISQDVARADQLAKRGASPQPAASSIPRPGSAATPAANSRANWPLIIGTLVIGGGAIVWIIVANQSSSGSSASSYASSGYTPPDYTPPAYEPPAYEPPAYTPPVYPTPSYPSPEPENVYPTAPATIVESRPAIAAGAVHSIGELAYCLAEDMRIEASDRTLDSSSQYQIDQYNAYVEDFNVRCGSFRYDASDMTAAKASVEQRRFEIEQEGTGRFR